MYQYSVTLPPFSNREDFLLVLGINDDDTLAPIDLSGITLANTGANFTASAWTVTDGGIITASVTPITIPMFPVTGGTAGNNLTALALTVATNLAIKAGDPIEIADTATGLNSVTGYVTSYTASNGALVVQIGWTFQFEIRRGGPRNQGSGYIPWWDWGTPDDLGPLLTANFGNGYLSLIDKNLVQILIPESIVKTLGATGVFAPSEGDAPGTYKAAMTGTDSINTRQFLVASQPIYYGGVTN
jgi:hypothetical protein